MFKRKLPSSDREIKNRLQSLKSKLEQLQEMKRLLADEGIKPDQEDKAKESKLIQQILGLEKDIKRTNKQKDTKQKSF